MEHILLEFELAMEDVNVVMYDCLNNGKDDESLVAIFDANVDGVTRDSVKELIAGGIDVLNANLRLDDFTETPNGMNKVLAGESFNSIVKSVLGAPFKIIAMVAVAIATLLYKFASWIFNRDTGSAVLGSDFTKGLPRDGGVERKIPSYFSLDSHVSHPSH